MKNLDLSLAILALLGDKKAPRFVTHDFHTGTPSHGRRHDGSKRGYKHVVNAAAKPSPSGLVSPAEYRRRSKKRNRIMKERRINHK